MHRRAFRDNSRRHEAGRKSLSSVNVPASLLVGPVGLEPTTYGLTAAVLVAAVLVAAVLVFWSGVLVWFVRTLADCGRVQLS
jgi:hypothetical protein